MTLASPLLSPGLCHVLDLPSLPSFILARLASRRRLSGPAGLHDPASGSALPNRPYLSFPRDPHHGLRRLPALEQVPSQATLASPATNNTMTASPSVEMVADYAP